MMPVFPAIHPYNNSSQLVNKLTAIIPNEQVSAKFISKRQKVMLKKITSTEIIFILAFIQK
jgi:hypothetical protein